MFADFPIEFFIINCDYFLEKYRRYNSLEDKKDTQKTLLKIKPPLLLRPFSPFSRRFLLKTLIWRIWKVMNVAAADEHLLLLLLCYHAN